MIQKLVEDLEAEEEDVVEVNCQGSGADEQQLSPRASVYSTGNGSGKSGDEGSGNTDFVSKKLNLANCPDAQTLDPMPSGSGSAQVNINVSNREKRRCRSEEAGEDPLPVNLASENRVPIIDLSTCEAGDCVKNNLNTVSGRAGSSTDVHISDSDDENAKACVSNSNGVGRNLTFPHKIKEEDIKETPLSKRKQSLSGSDNGDSSSFGKHKTRSIQELDRDGKLPFAHDNSHKPVFVRRCDDKDGGKSYSQLSARRSHLNKLDGIGDDSSSDSDDPLSDRSMNLLIKRITKRRMFSSEDDLRSSFEKDPELCMSAVCALYRQQFSPSISSKALYFTKSQGLSQSDKISIAALGEYLIDGDPENKLRKAVEEPFFPPWLTKFITSLSYHLLALSVRRFSASPFTIVLLKHLIKLEHIDVMDEAVDEAIGDEMNGLDAVDGRQLRSKESDYTLRCGNSNMLQSHEVVTLGEGDHYQSTPNLFTDILDGRNLDRIGSSEHASASPRCMNDTGVMVEELTLRNYNGENLAVVGTLGNKETMQVRPSQWFYQLAGGSACASSHGEAAYRDRCRTSSGLWEEEGDTLITGLLNQKTVNENHNLDGENLHKNGDKALSNSVLPSSEGIRTKIFSKSGFSEYIVKNTLKGKGIICKTKLPRVSASESQGQNHPQCPNTSPTIASVDAFVSPFQGISEMGCSVNPNVYQDGIGLRERLKAGGYKLNKDEGLYIFKQVLGLVDFAHSQGIIVQDLRPSCFKLLRSNQVVYIGASVRTQLTEGVSPLEHNQKERSSAGKYISSLIDPRVKKQKLGEDTHLKRKWPQYPFKSGHKSACTYTKLNAAQGYGDETHEEDCLKTEPNNPKKFSLPQPSIMSKPLLTSMSFKLEEKWYTSPEQFSEGGCTFSSNIYCLGVLLFELLSSFDCERSHAAAMLDLRHRILPSCFLSEHPKEAGFCLFFLHPEASARPSTREILQSEVIAGIKELAGDVSLSSIHEEESESELLMYFLMSLKDQKQEDATKLVEELKSIEADVQEVQRRQSRASFPSSHRESLVSWENRFIQKGASSSDVYPKLPPVCENETRSIKNIRQLESAYFSMRSNIQPSAEVSMVRRTQEIFNHQENFVLTGNDKEKYRPTDQLGGFFDGLCKYGRYSKFRVGGILRNADLKNSANVICSLSFDRDEEYLAAGLSKKIKVFEYHALFDDSVDIHYPILEMSNKSKLSCICWNSYIRNYLATTDYDGAVMLWDASTGQAFSHLTEHNERAWSVDFSRVDPTKLVSGSDDHLVKLWSINEKKSVCTIRNKANVCCVQFSPDSSHYLAYSSADYKTYCYDLRNTSAPWCILAGHEKAVSYAKFLDAETLISASTDNSLKIWDLNKTNSSGYSTDACILTLKGHTNEKNFVGLSVNNGYITCGSETNEVFAYYKSLPIPITSHKFGSIDPISGKETDDDNGQFVSSVCWRQKSNTVLAANSSCCIKLLEMV
ncbi:hypothetical protein K7X08_029465 [Anisodus acutangulus]|uniref:Uncharacterized protein n=1 Tax=Anisodus acutangulus TaxID=402998 RepID=A0A9Q1L4D4_9SOLA|nr:hypothetical protein K7X08_029465 [Anisodus acutangulus]